jgi:hypothetical protein
MDGERRTPASPAVAVREGRASFPKIGKKTWRMNVELSVKKRKALNMKNKAFDLCETV